MRIGQLKPKSNGSRVAFWLIVWLSQGRCKGRMGVSAVSWICIESHGSRMGDSWQSHFHHKWDYNRKYIENDWKIAYPYEYCLISWSHGHSHRYSCRWDLAIITWQNTPQESVPWRWVYSNQRVPEERVFLYYELATCLGDHCNSIPLNLYSGSQIGCSWHYINLGTISSLVRERASVWTEPPSIPFPLY